MLGLALFRLEVDLEGICGMKYFGSVRVSRFLVVLLRWGFGPSAGFWDFVLGLLRFGGVCGAVGMFRFFEIYFS